MRLARASTTSGKINTAILALATPVLTANGTSLLNARCAEAMRRRRFQDATVSGNLARRVQLGQLAVLYCRVSTADQTCGRPGKRSARRREKGRLQSRRGLVERNRLRS